MSSRLIVPDTRFMHHNIGDVSVRLRREDETMSVPDLFRPFPDMKWGHYMENDGTVAFLLTLSLKVRRPVGLNLKEFQVAKACIKAPYLKARINEVYAMVNAEKFPKDGLLSFKATKAQRAAGIIPLITIVKGTGADAGGWCDEIVALGIAYWLDTAFQIDILRCYRDTHFRQGQISSAFSECLATIPLFDDKLLLRNVSTRFNAEVARQCWEEKGRKPGWEYTNKNVAICREYDPEHRTPSKLREAAKEAGILSKDRQSGCGALYAMYNDRGLISGIHKYYFSQRLAKEDCSHIAWSLYDTVRLMIGAKNVNPEIVGFLTDEAVKED